MRHFLFAFCWLLISVSDSADVGEILGHWAGCAVLFFLTLSVSQSAVPPLSAASPLRAPVSFPPRRGPAVCLGVTFVSAPEMSLGSWSPTRFWLFAGIQSLRLSGLDQLPNLTHFPQGRRGREGVWRAVREDGEGMRQELGTGWQGEQGSSERTEVDSSSLPPSGSTDFREAAAYLPSSTAHPGRGAVAWSWAEGWLSSSKRRPFGFPSSLPSFLCHCSWF